MTWSLQCNDSGGTSGDVVISTAGVSGSYIGSTGKMALFSGIGTAELYYQDSKKFETTGTGAIVTGILTATSFSEVVQLFAIGTTYWCFTSNRW